MVVHEDKYTDSTYEDIVENSIFACPRMYIIFLEIHFEAEIGTSHVVEPRVIACTVVQHFHYGPL